MWMIESKFDKTRLSPKGYPTWELAELMLERIPSPENYVIVPEDQTGLSQTSLRMLREGMIAGDLRGILLPKLSVDQYLPSDPKSDNVVLAWFIKGVPEAVLPVKNYIDHCNGVVDVDYGDSEAIPNCSIVYAELLRDKLNTENIHEMVRQMAALAKISPEDFTLTFPNTEDKFPYHPEILDQYFAQRSAKDNQRAQEQALHGQAENRVDSEPEQTQIHTEAELDNLVNRING